MAIILKSPKKRQRIFFWIVALFVLSVSALTFLIVFPPQSLQPTVTPDQVVIPDIKINFDILDSDQVGSLELLSTTTITNGKPGRQDPFAPY